MDKEISEEERQAKEVEEVARRKLEERGLLVSDASLPSGGSATKEEIIAKYAKGKITRKEYEDAIKK